MRERKGTDDNEGNEGGEGFHICPLVLGVLLSSSLYLFHFPCLFFFLSPLRAKYTGTS